MGFRDDFQKQWNKFQGDHFFSYASAMKSLTRGIDNKWIPEYNVQPKLSSYSIPILVSVTPFKGLLSHLLMKNAERTM